MHPDSSTEQQIDLDADLGKGGTDDEGRLRVVHGDSPGAVDAARAVRSALAEAGHDVRPCAG